MALDLADARAAMQLYLMPDAATITTPGAPISNGRGGTTPGPATTANTVCSVSAVSGEEAAEPIAAVRGRYRISFPYGTVISESAIVATLSRRFTVKWAPPTGGLDLDRTVGAEELR